jgi:hypothetical protein
MSFVEQTHLRQSNMLSIPALPDSFNEGHQEAEEQPSMLSEDMPDTSITGLVPSPMAVPTTPAEKQAVQPTPPTTPAEFAAFAATPTPTTAATPTPTPIVSTTPRSKIPSPHQSRLHQPQSRRKKATASRDQHSRLPSSKSSSVFDRLYKTQTAASKTRTPARAQARKTNASNRKGAGAGIDDALKVFSRLHITGTVANTSKRVQPRHYSSSIARFTPEKTRISMEKAHSMQSPAKTPTHRLSKSPRKNYVYSPRMKPITKLYFDSKYHPGLGVETIEPIKLGYTFFQAFCEYENGGMDSRQLAREMILAFFKKDFPAGR